MLQYNRKNREDNTFIKSNISRINDITLCISAIQPYIKNDVADLIDNKVLSIQNDGVHVNKPILFKSPNNDFIWPREYPLHFDYSQYEYDIIIPKEVTGHADIRGWDLSSSDCIMSYAPFEGSSISSIDVSGGNTKNVVWLNSTFRLYPNITEIDLSTWDLSNVQGAMYAFAYLNNLTSLKFNEKGMPKLKYAQGMFKLSNIEGGVLDLKQLRPQAIVNADHMFYGSKFTEIDLRGGTFSFDCINKNFAKRCNRLQVFNGVELNRQWLDPAEELENNWTSVCWRILEDQGYVAREKIKVETYAEI